MDWADPSQVFISFDGSSALLTTGTALAMLLDQSTVVSVGTDGFTALSLFIQPCLPTQWWWHYQPSNATVVSNTVLATVLPDLVSHLH